MTSKTDSLGVVNLLFKDNQSTYDSSISELYHNSIDAKSSFIKMYKLETKTKNWLIFMDNGQGMNMEEFKKYLCLFNNSRTEKKYGKFSFGGKQAMMKLCNNNGNGRGIVISKKEEEKSVYGEFVISELIKNGWDNQIKVKYTEDEDISITFDSLYRKLEYNKEEFNGTIICIELYPHLEEYFDEGNIERNIKTLLDSSNTKFYIGESQDNLRLVEYEDFIDWNNVDEEKKNFYKIRIYKDKKYPRFVYKKKYYTGQARIGKELENFDTTNKIKVATIGIYIVFSNNNEDENVEMNRNGGIIGYIPSFTERRYSRIRIKFKSNDYTDQAFAINHNKTNIQKKYFHKALVKLLNYLENDFYEKVKKFIPNEIKDKNECKIIDKLIQNKYSEGRKEVNVPGGRIDILTDKYIIEVKKYKDRYSALGQILVYSYHYKDRIKKIYVFGKNRDETFKEICGLYNVEVEYLIL